MPILFDTEEELDIPLLDEEQVEKWINKVIVSHDRILGEIGYLFCSDKKILEINSQYLQHDYYTDIITFDYCEDDVVSGDMFISLETVGSNAKLFAVAYEEELLRVIIHGVLHLCGFNDETDEEKTTMRKLENEALAIFIK